MSKTDTLDQSDLPVNGTRRTVCRICHLACPLVVEMEAGKPSKIYGDKNNPIYHGYSCIKGRVAYSYHTSEARLLHSMKRSDDGEYRPIESDTACKEIAGKVRELLDQYGPRSIACFIGTPGWNNLSQQPLPHQRLRTPSPLGVA